MAPSRHGNRSDNNSEGSRGHNSDVNVGVAIAAAIAGAVVMGAAWLFSSLSSSDSNSGGGQPPPRGGSSAAQSPASPSSAKSSFDASKVQVAHESEQNIVCSVCLENKANCLFQPCGHVKVCCGCAALVVVCPICRKPIEDKLGPVYM